MSKLPYTFWCYHLTETEGLIWRPEDWDSRTIVRGLQGEPFKGALRVRIDGQDRQFTKENIREFLNLLLPMIGRHLRDDIKGPISIVPVPDSNMAVGKRGPFRTPELAKKIADGYEAGTEVVNAILWNLPRYEAQGPKEFRHPDAFQPLMRLGDRPSHPVVLFGDVLNSGTHMIAAARFLMENGVTPVRGLAIAREVKTQLPGKCLEKRTDELDIGSNIFNFDQL